MPRRIILLRGINLGATNRIAMPALRDALTGLGLHNVKTYVQSGNVVADSELDEERLAARVHGLIAERFGLEVPVVVRSADELADVVSRNPFTAEAAANPKALQVTFRGDQVTPELLAALEARATPSEKVGGVGREIYTWHPEGIARSKLGMAVTPGASLATARNWSTVTTLLEMATTHAG